MQRSGKPTEYIFIKAETNSEYDGCDFIIVKVSKEWAATMQERLLLLEIIKKAKDFSHISFTGTIEGFYVYADYATGHILQGREPWCFIDITADELQDLEEVNSELYGLELNIDFFGNGSYEAHAVQSNDSFYTEGFKIAEVLCRLSTCNMRAV